MHHLGRTRSTTQTTHSLHTPDTFVRTRMPGMERAMAIIHTSPAMGAFFSQYSVEFEAKGVLGPTPAQRFLYVIAGEVVLEVAGKKHRLKKNGYAYLPEATKHRVVATTAARVEVIEKPYDKVAGVAAPKMLISSEEKATSQPLMGDEDLQVRSLLPDTMSFDFAVNTMTYQPGAALQMVEVHVMEHGLLMLEGGGIYRLGDNWYSVKEGDFIWMGPYCPQWFGALGKVPAKYLIYKDWNRDSLL
ncbi:MAG: (S)-ureidoglycine aminohydrolase [Acidobacteriaceae bacterium]